jgi:hypothetical protein
MDCSHLLPSLEEASLSPHSSQQSGDLTTSLLLSATTPVPILSGATSPVLICNQPSYVGPQLTFEQEEEL